MVDLNIDSLFDEVIKSEDKVTKKFSSGGKGRKQCPSCKEYVGARSHVCDCGYNFSEQAQQKAVERQVESIPDDVRKYILGINPQSKRVLTIYFPKGKCPLTLDSYDYESVKAFCEDIVDIGLKSNMLYLPSAIKYWARNTVRDKNIVETLANIDKWVQGIVNEVN